MASWNVEGLSDVKLWELTGTMRRRNISVLAIQETRVSKSPYYTTEDGFLVILSGSRTEDREYAGVGFILAPWIRNCIVGFLQKSNRLACVKLRVPQGRVAVISAYAPHGGYPFDTRQTFFEQLSETFCATSVNGLKMVLGVLMVFKMSMSRKEFIIILYG